MPQTNNDFTHDTDGQHIERTETLKIGIDIYGTALSFSVADIDTIKTYCDDIKAAMLALAKEKADVDEVYVELHDAEATARIKYRACQDYVRGEMQVASIGTTEYLNERFNIHGGAPDRREDFIDEVDEMLHSYANIAVEHPDITLVPVLFDEMIVRLAALRVAKDAVPRERAQESEASVIKRILMETTGYSILRWVYQRAISFWGDEDGKLLELGFVPKSMIHTPSEPEPGTPTFPDAVANLKVELNFLDLLEITFDYATQAGVTFDHFKADVKIGDPLPVLHPAEPWLSGVEGHSVTDPHPQNNRTNVYWVVPVNDGVEGEIAAPVSFDYKPGEEPIVP